MVNADPRLMQVATDLVDAIKKTIPPPDNGRAWGTVTSLTPLKVTFPGDDVGSPVSRAEDYTPAVGHVVGLVRFGVRWTIVCRIV